MKVLAVCAALILTGCVEHRVSAPVTETRTVEAGAAESARVEIEMGAGELRVEPGSEHLLSGQFRSDPNLKPEIRYDVTARRGYLTVRQPSFKNVGIGSLPDSEWDLKLGDRLPTELRVKLGAGKTVLKLAGLMLRRLNVEIGVGEVEVDLTGSWKEDLEAEVHGGVGEATIRLPQDAGVRVHASGGLGEIKATNLRRQGSYWTNEQYGKSAIDLRLEVRGGIGSIKLIG